MDTDIREHLETTFRYNSPSAAEEEKFRELQNEAKAFALKIESECPESRERALAFTKIEEAVLWAVASLTRS